MNQRIVKFRAWDYADRSMKLVGGIVWDKGIIQEVDSDEYEDNLIWRNGDGETGLQPEGSNFVLMQFTGLLDRNGREIYDHDIVEMEIHSQFGVVKRVGEVVNHIAAFCVRFEGVEFEILNVIIEAAHGDNPLNVIGNVFEHPELLTPSKKK